MLLATALSQGNKASSARAPVIRFKLPKAPSATPLPSLALLGSAVIRVLRERSGRNCTTLATAEATYRWRNSPPCQERMLKILRSYIDSMDSMIAFIMHG
jgi:hypothetical protein